MPKLPDRLILDFISRVWFGSPVDFFDDLPHEEQRKLLVLFSKHKLEALAYYVLKGHLPRDVEVVFQEKYRNISISALKSKIAFEAFCRFFEEKNIRFAPIKGVDLVVRYYPTGALREFCDWDVLIHPDDCVQALCVLSEDNWEHEAEIDLETTHFHYTTHYKNGFFLEPHKTFNMFDNVPIREVWEYLTPEAPGRMKHLLPPELNILQLARHAASNEYWHLPVIKFLQDAAVLISKESINWQKLKQMSKQWNLPYPGDLLSAWTDFFPESILEQMAYDKLKSEKFRQMFIMQDKLYNAARSEWEMSCHKQGRMDFILQRLNCMTPSGMFKKYQLSGSIRWLLLPFIYPWDLLVKICRFVFYSIKPDKKIKNYHQLVEDLENSNG